MSTETIVLHHTFQVRDHMKAVTLCGLPCETDHERTNETQRGDWVMCPLCELRATLIEMGYEAMPDDPRKHDAGQGEQLTLF